MKDLLAVQRYTAALFELARETRTEGEIMTELLSFSEALKSSTDLENFFESPRFTAKEKESCLEKIFTKSGPAHETLVRFLSLLLNKNRFGLLHEIAQCFKGMEEEEGGEGVALVKTVMPLDAEHERTILRHLERIQGYKLRVEKKLDPSLVGGVYVKFKNKILDGSVRNKIGVLKKELMSAAR